MDGDRPINLRPIRLASDAKLARWRTEAEAALRTPRPLDETDVAWASALRWVAALLEAIDDEQADRRRTRIPRIKRA